jgi:hypothetical protein
LQELVGRRTTEVLPTLQNLFLEELQPPGPIQEGMVGKWEVHFRAAGHQLPYNGSLRQLDTWQGSRDQYCVLLTVCFVYLPAEFPLHPFHDITLIWSPYFTARHLNIAIGMELGDVLL